MANKRTVAGTAADPVVPFARLVAGADSYKLVADLNALAEWEAQTGLNILSGGLTFNNPSITHLRGMLWAAMKPMYPDTTIEDAGRVFAQIMAADHISITQAIVKVTRALCDAYQVSRDDDEQNPTEATPAAQG